MASKAETATYYDAIISEWFQRNMGLKFLKENFFGKKLIS